MKSSGSSNQLGALPADLANSMRLWIVRCSNVELKPLKHITHTHTHPLSKHTPQTKRCGCLCRLLARNHISPASPHHHFVFKNELCVFSMSPSCMGVYIRTDFLIFFIILLHSKWITLYVRVIWALTTLHLPVYSELYRIGATIIWGYRIVIWYRNRIRTIVQHTHYGIITLNLIYRNSNSRAWLEKWNFKQYVAVPYFCKDNSSGQETTILQKKIIRFGTMKQLCSWSRDHKSIRRW